MIQEDQVGAIASSITELTDKGLYKDAKRVAESKWGPIKTWAEPEQVIIAIRLMYHLGGDRLSDALLIKAYRASPEQSDLIERMLFYRLNRHGLILADDFLQGLIPTLEKNADKEAEVLAFRSVLARELKDFTEAEMYLSDAIAKKPEDKWIPTLKVRLLLDQEQDKEALDVAKSFFAENPTVLNLRLLIMVIQKIENLKSGIAFLKEHIEAYQSCILWMQLASMCATELDWEGCEHAISQFEQLKSFDDKYDDQRLLAYKGQIKIHKGDYQAALSILQGHKGEYWKTVCENLSSAPEDAATKVLDVPFYRQEHLTCAPTTMAAIANFWGKSFDSKAIAEQICFSGTPDTKERQWLRDNNFSFVEFDLKTQDVYQLIDLGIPFCLVTTSGFTSHLQAVIGYNRHVGSMFIMDPSFSGMQEMLIAEGIKHEAYHGPRCMAFVPNDKADLLAKFVSDDIAIYQVWDEYVVARELNDVAKTKNSLAALQKLNPEHRLCEKAERDYALSMADYATVLDVNEKLLKRYPNETTLLSSQYFCLRDLGRREEGLKRLETYLNKHFNVDLTNTLFDELCGSNKEPALLRSLLEKLRRYGSHQADVHHSLGHYYWGLGKRDIASKHYRYAYCLDETNNTFIENYFKACRFLGQEQKAVDFMLQRADKYALRSPAPAMSLFRVYELQNEDHKGIEVLEKALSQHPKDIDLIQLLSSALIMHGRFDRLNELDPIFKQGLSGDDYDSLHAEINIKRGIFADALVFYKRKFEESPFLSKSSDNYFSLLYRLQNIKQLDSSLEELYEQNPDNAYACDYLIQWHSNDKLKKEVLIKSVEARDTNGDLRRKLIDKYLLLGDKVSALALAKDSFKLLENDEINEAYLARALNRNGEFEQAKIHAQSVLSKAIDNDIAFDELMFSCRNNDEKREALSFVLEQISTQVVFGDSVWNYWFEAKNLFDKAHLESFIQLLLEKHSHLWFTYAIAGFYYKQLGSLDEAVAFFESGIQKFPFTPRLHKELGHIFELMERSDHAIACYKTAMQINPAWPEVTKLLVDLYEKKSAIPEAMAALESTLLHVPDDGILQGYLSDLLLQQKEDEKAIIHLKKAVEFQADYPWAWRQLELLGEQFDQVSLAIDTARELVQKYPHVSQVWCNLAKLCTNREEQHANIRKAIAVNPLHENAYVALVSHFLDNGDYQNALNAFNDTPWGEHLPFNLMTNKANVFAQIGQYENAISTLRELLYSQPGYSNLWQNYYEWLYKVGNKKAIVEAAHKQIELNKHDPSNLCYASEVLLKEGDESDQSLAKEQLLRAFKLAPNDQYVVLTLADVYLDDKQFEEALQVLKDFEVFKQISFGTARQILCLLALDRTDEALTLFDHLLKQDDADYWCINKPFESFVDKIGIESSLALFDERLDTLNEVNAYIWADTIVSKRGAKHYKTVIKQIGDSSNPELVSGALRAILESWNDQGIKPDYKLIEQHKKSIVSSSPIFEQVSMLLLGAQKFDKLIELYEQFEQPDDLSMYCFYQVRCAYQFKECWDDAGKVVELGMQRRPDNVMHNMRLWYLYEYWRKGSIFDESELDVIDYHELIEVERYVYSTLKVAVQLGADSLEDCLERITPALRRCQQDNQEASGNYLATHAQKLLRSRLESRITSTGFFARLMMKWKLSNRF
ncbi:C39 family peptidase [Glaciecola sp. MH2013]|uniref:C39 family peptidase n=1 Tax=Glaciecola sp. MH2013 TaxID=2785524 RepID=UPI00189E4745|nr:C39 family peptidase [Glaciecola sp. MH2013]MBF7074803.1 C39 family peptidase [Glaciecola sp. MH2013]